MNKWVFIAKQALSCQWATLMDFVQQMDKYVNTLLCSPEQTQLYQK